DVLAGGIEFGDRGLSIKLSPQVSEAVTKELAKQLERLVSGGHPPVLVCSPQIRAGLRQITQNTLPKLAVLSLNEITRDTAVQPHGQVPLQAIRTGGPAVRPLQTA